MKVIKDSASVRGLAPQVFHAWDVFNELYKDRGYSECVLTSGTDSRHGYGSLHYVGLAIDIRSNVLKSVEEKKQILGLAQRALGSEYDVVLEDLGGRNEHYHIEYQPKTKLN